MLLRLRFFIALLCVGTLSHPLYSMNTQPARATFLIATAALEVGVCMNWGYIISAAIRSPLNVDEVKNLPRPFLWCHPKDNSLRGFLFGLGIIATYLALPIEPLDYCINKFGIAGLPLFLGGHYIAYSLAKRALQWRINRSQNTPPTNDLLDDIEWQPLDLDNLEDSDSSTNSQHSEEDLDDNNNNSHTGLPLLIPLKKQAQEWYAKLLEDNREMCPICHDKITPENLHMTCCKQKQSYATHYYCEECINAWKKKGNNSCPQCKGTML